MGLKAQGAMEYLMTYGWAILVVMVVGVAMWQLGIFKMGTSVPPTSSGFEALKPLLATCNGGNKVTGALKGFSCQFINLAGEDIKIQYINVTINGRECNNTAVDVLGGGLTNQGVPNSYLTTRPGYGCFDAVGNTACESPNGPLRVSKDSQFTVVAYDECASSDYDNSGQVENNDYDNFFHPCWLKSASVDGCGRVDLGFDQYVDPYDYNIFTNCWLSTSSDWDGVCSTLSPGQAYDAAITVTYELDVGGQRTTKTTSGRIHGVAA